jgi:hypothetical protein
MPWQRDASMQEDRLARNREERNEEGAPEPATKKIKFKNENEQSAREPKEI